MYQGKNTKSINIPDKIAHMPTTQKAVLTAVIQSGFGNNPEGMWRLFMDNRYTAALLFVILQETHKILCIGTTRANRIGWPKDAMNLRERDNRNF